MGMMWKKNTILTFKTTIQLLLLALINLDLISQRENREVPSFFCCLLSITHKLQDLPIPLRPNRSQSAVGEELNNDETYFKVTGKEKKAAVRVSLIISVWSSGNGSQYYQGRSLEFPE